MVKQINHDPAAYSLYTTMVGRHAVERHQEDARLVAEAEQRRLGDDGLVASERVVQLALTLGGGVRCPHCAQLAIKDDACMHMDSCPCRGGRFCYACGGRREDCSTHTGCGSLSIYLERYPGYQDFGGGASALREFHRRRTEAIRRGRCCQVAVLYTGRFM